ncbi:type III secretion protein [Salmonella enterica subsp. enterica serovar Tennessee str. 3133]|nr:type III secretion system protein SsaI [Salmonella enterica subsp. enterica serovar Montevideo str. IA_2010008287]ESF22100.1 type III secretion system protein SsaI [Salmonella enterica subsp. enterica serovar Tennessee str. TXSC_TXSC08-21]RFD82498.1 type III secretion protein [Salmonella enterica subsp. enterica serovar Tennessee str. 3133]
MLKDDASTSNASALLPQVMLTRQMDYMQLTVGVDYLARISGAASQALNKLDSMT